MEEIPEAYKDVSKVVQVVHDAGLAIKVARIKPLGVIKGERMQAVTNTISGFPLQNPSLYDPH